MPPKKNATNGDAAASPAATAGHNCNDNEVKLMLAILQNIARPTTWDMEKIAEAVGATNAKSAAERIRTAANKHNWFAGGAEDGSGTPKTPRAKKTPVSRKKKAASEGDDDEQPETPTKKRAKTAGKAKAKGEPQAEEDLDAVGEEIKPKVEECDAVKDDVVEEGQI